MAPTLLTTSHTYIPQYHHHHHSNNNNIRPSWEQLLSHFESQPEILQLIQSCRVEEQKRCYEETRTKMKQDHVYHQIENMKTRDLFSEKIPERHISLRLPPLYH